MRESARRASVAGNPTPRASRLGQTGWARGDLSIAAGTLALGLVVLAGATGISAGAGYDRIGPRFFPYAVATALLVMGAWLGIARLWTSPTADAGELDGVTPFDPRPLAWIALALLVSLALLERAGFVIASSLLFWLVARAFRSPRPGADAVAALLLAVTVYVVFSRGLGLQLPAGIIGSLF